MRQKNKLRMQKKRKSQSKEEHEAAKVKDKIRNRTGPRIFPAPKYSYNGTYRSNEKDINREYKRRIRKPMNQAEIEYENVDNLLKMRHKRQARNGKEHLMDNLTAKQGMRDLRVLGRVTGIGLMRRAKREKDEEVLWWRYWNRGKKFKELLQVKKPETAAAMKEKEEMLNKKEEERKKLEEELDAKGRWVWRCGEYYWSVPDENGVQKSLSQYEYECEALEPKLSPEEEEKKKENRRKEKEEWRKHDQQLLEWADKERKDKQNKRKKELRQKQKEELNKPITMPKQIKKGAYEKARDQTILERYNAMKESGMFCEKELQYMIKMIS